MKAFLLRILNFFHLYTKAQLAEMTASAESDKKSLDDYISAINALEAQVKLITAKCDTIEQELQAKKEEVRSKDILINMLDRDIEGLNKKVQIAKDAEAGNIEIIKGYQKQVADLFHEHPVFGLVNCMPIPGCSSFAINETKLDDKSCIVLDGKAIVTEDFVQQLQETSSGLQQMTIIVEFMERYGLAEQIGKAMIRNGAVAISLGYNKDNQQYEVYYETAAVPVEGSIITFKTE